MQHQLMQHCATSRTAHIASSRSSAFAVATGPRQPQSTTVLHCTGLTHACTHVRTVQQSASNYDVTGTAQRCCMTLTPVQPGATQCDMLCCAHNTQTYNRLCRPLVWLVASQLRFPYQWPIVGMRQSRTKSRDRRCCRLCWCQTLVVGTRSRAFVCKQPILRRNSASKYRPMSCARHWASSLSQRFRRNLLEDGMQATWCTRPSTKRHKVQVNLL